jgi:ribulose-phosphate 3-epimerase
LVHHVLAMSVNPGVGGQTFIHSSPKKIESLSKVRESRGCSFGSKWMAAFTTTR